MAVKKGTTSDWQLTRGVLRALGVRAGLQPGDKVGLPFLIAAVAKTADLELAESVLKSAGVKDVRGFLAAVPDVGQADIDRLPELKADRRMAKTIKGKLAGFVTGEVGSGEALKMLLSPSVIDRDVRRFQADPTTLFVSRPDDDLQSTRELVQALAGYYQPRFHAGYQQFSVDASRGYSNFLQKNQTEAFVKVAEELRDDECRANRTVFASRLYDRSPLGSCRRKYGELEAHILGAAILGEMTLVAQGPLSVNALTWAVDPCRYHRLAGLVLEKTVYLRDEGILVVRPDDDVRLNSRVLPDASTMSDWLTYLRKADPITDEEVQNALKMC